MSDLTSLTISDLSAGLSKKDFSAKELCLAINQKIERNQELNAFITSTPEQALSQAEQSDQNLASQKAGVLEGIPVAIKDVILTKGIRTTAASKMLGNFIPPYNATVTNKLYSAGISMPGKTNLDEFAMGGSNEYSAFGAVKNPWDLTRVPGGSSGGSAAAVAAGLVPAALGTDTGGSIRQPASFCGIVGIKPTYGRVSRYGVVAFASSLDQVGVFSRNVTDAAKVLETISGHCNYDSTSVELPAPQYTKNLSTEIKGKKIGIPKEYFISGLQTEVEQSVRAAIKHFESLGAIPVEISLPHTEVGISTYYIIAPAEAASNLSRYDGIRYGHRSTNASNLKDLYCKSRAEGFGREVQRRILIGTYVLSSGYYDAYYLQAQKVRKLIAQDFSNAFTQCDFIVCPTAPTTAFEIGAVQDPVSMYLCDIFTIPTSLAGLPGMSIPCGFDQKNLPIGMQLIGKPWDEQTLFNAALAYESSTDWHKRKPIVK